MTSRTGMMIPNGPLEMLITEPGGFGFMEKIKNLKDQCNAKDIMSLIFVLKPIFVGRDQDNGISTIYGTLIPFIFKNIKAKFDFRGGWYNCSGVINYAAAGTRAGATGVHMNYAFTDKNVSFQANTIQEAFSALEQKLQSNYDETYENKLSAGGARKLVYSVKADPSITGDVNSILKNSFAPNDIKKFAFDPKKEISSFVYDIMARSPTLNAKIGESKDAYTQEFHPSAFMPVIVPRVYPKAGEVEVIYDVKLYKGGGPKFEFDYFFAGAGKNVDILSYEVAFTNLWVWMATRTDWSLDYNVNMSATMPTYDTKTFVNNIVHPDTTREMIYGLEAKKTPINMFDNDVAYLATIPHIEKHGFNIHSSADVPAVRSAYDSFAAFNGSINPQQTMTIRGNLDIFNLCTAYPDGEKDMLNVTEGAWIKINTYMMDDLGNRHQFYYTGYWGLLSVVNIFSGGKFIQQLTMVYMSSQDAGGKFGLHDRGVGQ
jgi:hypothetical protein